MLDVLPMASSPATRTLGSLRYTLEPRPGYLRVRYEGRVDTVEVAETWFAELEAQLQSHGVGRILWDSRPAKGHPAPVRERIWSWLEEARVIKASAILVKSEMLRLSGNLSAIGGTLVLRSFHDEQEAEHWLLKQPD